MRKCMSSEGEARRMRAKGALNAQDARPRLAHILAHPRGSAVDGLVVGGLALAGWGLWRLSPAILATVAGVLCVDLGVMLSGRERRRR